MSEPCSEGGIKLRVSTKSNQHVLLHQRERESIRESESERAQNKRDGKSYYHHIGGLSRRRRRLRAYFVVFAIASQASQRVFCNNLNFAILDQIVGNGTRARVFFPRLLTGSSSAVVKFALMLL